MTTTHRLLRQHGTTLVELMVAMAISLFLVAAAAYVYLGTRTTQRAIDRSSSDTETGTFALQLIGHQIEKAGFYPATRPRITPLEPRPKVTSYPPPVVGLATDWIAPATTPSGVFLSGIFGCSGAKFLPATGTCGLKATADPTTGAGAPDTIVINYFTNDAPSMGSFVGDRRDCLGNDAGSDTTNAGRLNTANTNAPPLQPVFVSNRFTLNLQTTTEVDKQNVTTNSLACNGNGMVTQSNTYQPILDGIEDLQITYGIFASTIDTSFRTPDTFYTADQVNQLKSITVDTGLNLASLSPWSRVSAVRVCIMTKSMGSSPRIADQPGATSTYLDCKDVSHSNDNNIRKRFVQVFGARNNLNQVF